MVRVVRAVIAFTGLCSSVSVLLDLVGPVFHFPLIDYADHRDHNHQYLKAYVSITLDDCFVISELKLVRGRDGRYYVDMPQRKRPNGKYIDIVGPITPEARRMLEEKVIKTYRMIVDEPILRRC